MNENDNRGFVIESKGNWHLCYHSTLDGRHSFTIEKITNRIELYDGITLEKAKERFNEIVGAEL